MKFSILQQDLLPALSAVARSVGVKVNLPVLSNILISAEDSRLKMSATNLEIGVIKSINCEVLDPGDITIPAKTIFEIIQSLGPVKIEIETRGELMEITAGKFRATINGTSASEFPVIPLGDGPEIIFSKDVLTQIPAIIFAAAVDEGRPTLTGVLAQASESVLNLVATDGFRLAHKAVNLKDKELNLKVLVPKRTFEEVLKVISEEGSEDIRVSTSNSQNQIIFKIGNSTISSRLIEGPFPSWEKLIPKNSTTRLVIDRTGLLSAVKLASVFARDNSIITIKLDNEQVVIESSSKELGNQQNQIEGQVEGEKLQIAYNARFLQDVVSNANANQLIMEFNGPLSATLIKPMGVEGLEYILMPVRQS